MRLCACGCGRVAIQQHHVVYAQHCRAEGASIRDRRNLIPVAQGCHGAHHNRTKPYSLASLPTSAFEFAEEVFGAGRAFNYLRRRYADEDPRLDELLCKESSHA